MHLQASCSTMLSPWFHASFPGLDGDSDKLGEHRVHGDHGGASAVDKMSLGSNQSEESL